MAARRTAVLLPLRLETVLERRAGGTTSSSRSHPTGPGSIGTTRG